MTLPFRRRHHDDEASHDRARATWSTGMLEPLRSDDEAWLTGHLEGCGECRVDRERYLADRELLRSLRAATPEPPRDLWARTSAAIEREATRGSRLAKLPRGTRRPARPFATLPLGAASGLLVVVVVVGAALVARNTIVPPVSTPGATDVARVSLQPGPTPLSVAAAGVGWLRPGADGNWEFIVADIDEVCPGERPGCPHLEQSVRTPLRLGAPPVGVTLSPIQDEIVVISAGDASRPARILVVPVPVSEPSPSPAGSPSTSPSTPDEPSPIVTDPEPQPTAEGTREIANGIVVVGEAAYSADGQWLAFSARPGDLSTGPDLYLWRAGTSLAVAVTSDHRTYFSSWFGGRILASRVELVAAEPAASDAPDGSPSSDASSEPDGGSAGGTIEGRPVSFLLDPETLATTDLAEPDVWLPVVDPSGRVVVYWSGTVAPDADGLDWRPADGRLVLARWSGAVDGPVESGAPPAGPAEPAGSMAPAGEVTTLADGPIAAFDARFDPDGTRLGLWTLERTDGEHGRLELIILDPAAGTVDTTVEPLQGVPALRGFSIDHGRLAWVTPPGQDGQESSVQVLAWKERQFGHVETIPAPELIVLR